MGNKTKNINNISLLKKKTKSIRELKNMHPINFMVYNHSDETVELIKQVLEEEYDISPYDIKHIVDVNDKTFFTEFTDRFTRKDILSQPFHMLTSSRPPILFLNTESHLKKIFKVIKNREVFKERPRTAAEIADSYEDMIKMMLSHEVMHLRMFNLAGNMWLCDDTIEKAVKNREALDDLIEEFPYHKELFETLYKISELPSPTSYGNSRFDEKIAEGWALYRYHPEILKPELLETYKELEKILSA